MSKLEPIPLPMDKFMNLRCAVFGTGAVGTIVGAYLTKHGFFVDLFDSNYKHIEALRMNGAIVEGYANFNVSVSAFPSDQISKQYDIIFLSTKALKNTQVVPFLAPFLKESSVLVSLQDGHPEEYIPSVIGEHRCIFSSILWGSELICPGVVKLSSHPKSNMMLLSILNEKTMKKLLIVKEMLSTICTTIIHPNLNRLRWMRAIFISSLGGLSAVTGLTYGQLIENKDLRLLILSLAREAGEVSRAFGVHVNSKRTFYYLIYFNLNNRLKFFLVYYLFPIVYRNYRLLRTFMLKELLNKEKSEIDEFNGKISRGGETFKIPTPLNNDVVRCVHEIEIGKRVPSLENLDVFMSLPQLQAQFRLTKRLVLLYFCVFAALVVLVLVLNLF